MTENEYLKALITAAGGETDSLPDKLKSTLYECLIGCVQNGVSKCIVGVKDDSGNIVFSKTVAEIVDLGSDILKYDVTYIENKTKYTATAVTSTNDSMLYIDFNSTGDTSNKLISMFFNKNTGAIRIVTRNSYLMQNFPIPTGVSGTKYLTTDGNGYVLSDPPKAQSLLVLSNNGVLVPAQTLSFAEVVNVILNTQVFESYIMVVESGGGVPTEATSYRCVQIFNIDDAANVYGIFSSGSGANIKWDASGNVTYTTD